MHDLNIFEAAAMKRLRGNLCHSGGRFVPCGGGGGARKAVRPGARPGVRGPLNLAAKKPAPTAAAPGGIRGTLGAIVQRAKNNIAGLRAQVASGAGAAKAGIGSQLKKISKAATKGVTMVRQRLGIAPAKPIRKKKATTLGLVRSGVLQKDAAAGSTQWKPKGRSASVAKLNARTAKANARRRSDAVAKAKARGRAEGVKRARSTKRR